MHRWKSGLTGTAEINADGAATLRPNAVPLFSNLNANVSATGMALDKRPLGDLTATAETRGGEVAFALNSNFAHSTIKGSGRMQLGADYPVDAQVSFANVTYSGLNAWLQSTVQTFDGSLDGQVCRQRSADAHEGPARHAAAFEIGGAFGGRRRRERSRA